MRAAGPPPADTTAPVAPTGLAAAPDAQQVSLSWTENTDADLASYRVYRNGAGVAQVTSPSCVDTGLAAGATYTYAVSAVDASANESGRSATVSATPTRAPIDTSYTPSSYTITIGIWKSGTAASLGADDGKYL